MTHARNRDEMRSAYTGAAPFSFCFCLREGTNFVGDQPSIRPSAINLRALVPIELGICANLSHLYADAEPGKHWLRALRTIIPTDTLRHIQKKDERHRLAVLERRIHLINAAIQSPTLVYRTLDYHAKPLHYRQAFVAQDSQNSDLWLTVAVILANLPGAPRSAYHSVVTIHPASTRNFYDASGTLKSRWIQAK